MTGELARQAVPSGRAMELVGRSGWAAAAQGAGPRGVRLFGALSHLVGAVRGAGLVAAEERYILFFPWSGKAFRAIESGLRWLPMGAQYFVSARRPS